jgi:hypothetical protein
VGPESDCESEISVCFERGVTKRERERARSGAVRELTATAKHAAVHHTRSQWVGGILNENIKERIF